MLKIDLVIPVYNRKETTLNGLKSLSRIDKTGLDVRTIVVDDASPDGTAEAVAKMYPDVVLVHGNGSLHYAAGTNRGIAKALERNPDYIVTMNDDAVFHPQFLQRLVRAAETNERTIVGALLMLWDEPHRVFQVNQKWNTLKGGWVIPDDLTAFSVPQTPFEVECLVGNCVLFPTEAIQENGLMDEKRFPHGWGDAQYAMRMRKAGWKLLVEPKAYVWCEPNTYPKPLHSEGMRKAIKVLFSDERHPMNLKRQFVARWESAPSRWKAAVAFSFYCALLFGKAARHSLLPRKS